MKILAINGEFGHKGSEIHKGLIVFCTFEELDSFYLLRKASNKVSRLSENGLLIIVPFVHLCETIAEGNLAVGLFNKFCELCIKIKGGRVQIIPFGTEKEFFLYARADNTAFKFLNFSRD